MKLHFPAQQTPSDFNYQILNEINPTQSVFLIMDIKHTIKKIRNSFFQWPQQNAFNHPQWPASDMDFVGRGLQVGLFKSHSNPPQINPRLYLTRQCKKLMRNHLADVLDNDMLNLFLNIKEAQGGDGTKFDNAIALLQQT